ncbi:MAG TPA: cellulase family glycosylhydrolase [Candidatus Binatia bacterium]|nr:cellulase family glycosylhydrolase [Candidatus Binatia bacterium]
MIRIGVKGATLAIALALSACSDGGVAPPEGSGQAGGPQQLRRDGRWLVDRDGRVVLMHGVNLVWKNAPFVPADTPAGFRAADAAWLESHGFNSARIGVLWSGVSPQQGAIDASYLAAWDRIVQLLAAHRVWMLFDFHQDMLGPKYQGEGVPDWAVDALAGPATEALGAPTFGFPFNYFTPQVSEAFDNLWAEQGPIWDSHRDAWKAVAARWKSQPYSMGYDLLNEPWPGIEWSSCIVPPMVGCGDTDTSELQPFFENAIAGIRQVDRDNLVWLEPQTLSGGTGNPTGFEPIEGESQLGYSFHNYCGISTVLQSAQFPVPAPVVEEQGCEFIDGNVFDNARSRGDALGAVEMLTEFGATDDPVVLERVTRLADQHLVGWHYWQYKEWADPTTQSQDSGAQGIFADDEDLSTAKLDKLKFLQRTYPQATAGEPVSMTFDPETAQFDYTYKPHAATAPTEIYVPVALHYPAGYTVEVTGATVTSAANAPVLVLENVAGATEVVVKVTRK